MLKELNLIKFELFEIEKTYLSSIEIEKKNNLINDCFQRIKDLCDELKQ